MLTGTKHFINLTSKFLFPDLKVRQKQLPKVVVGKGTGNCSYKQ